MLNKFTTEATIEGAANCDLVAIHDSNKIIKSLFALSKFEPEVCVNVHHRKLGGVLEILRCFQLAFGPEIPKQEFTAITAVKLLALLRGYVEKCYASE